VGDRGKLSVHRKEERVRILHTMIRVRDIQKSLDFYCGFIWLLALG